MTAAKSQWTTQFQYTSDDVAVRISCAMVGPGFRRVREAAGLTGAQVMRRYLEIRSSAPSLDLREAIAEKSWYSKFETGSEGQYVSCAELKALLATIRNPIEVLMNEVVLKADPIVAADQARMFSSVLANAARSTRGDLLGWSGRGVFPCSLMTEAMMLGVHEALHSFVRMQVPEAVARRVRETFNSIGKEQIERFQSVQEGRSYIFRQLNSATDLDRLLKGRPPFGDIGAAVRREFAEHLSAILDNPAMKTELWARADDADTFLGLDSLVAFDRRFAFWRHASTGLIEWTEDPAIVAAKAEGLARFMAESTRVTGAELKKMIS